jgi:hypothetical protein
MAPAKPVEDDGWLELRRRHDTEWNGFHKHVQESKDKLYANIEKARVEILLRQKKEEAGYWSKNGNASKDTAADKPATPKTGVKSETTAKTPVPRPRKPPNSTTKGSQTPKSAKAQSTAATPTPRAAQKKVSVEIINLCDSDSDDEKPAVAQKKSAPSETPATPASQPQPTSNSTVSPAARQQLSRYTIPSASLTLFGNTPKSFVVSNQLNINVDIMLIKLGCTGAF